MEDTICEKCGGVATNPWGFLVMRKSKKEYHYGCSEEHATSVMERLTRAEYHQRINGVTGTCESKGGHK